MAKKKSNAARLDADLAAVYGIGVIHESYETKVGLWYHLPRVAARNAASILQGIGWAFSHDPLPDLYFDATTPLVENIPDVQLRTNAARALAQAKAELSR